MTPAEQTRALWREYLCISAGILGWAEEEPDAEAVGYVIGLLREQKRILNELIPEEK